MEASLGALLRFFLVGARDTHEGLNQTN